MNYNYIVTLTPLEPYFFGGNLTFGKKADKENGSYIAKSTMFPQQSTFFGMLKKEILSFHNALGKNENFEEMKGLVGSQRFAFNIAKKYTKREYGAIKSISNLYLKKDDNYYIALKDVFDFSLDKDNLLKDYNAKDGISLKLFKTDFSKKLKLDKVFTTVEQVGNSKKDDEDAFFKKISYKMLECFSFAYFVKFEHSFDLTKLDGKVVYFGADRSKFLLNVKIADEPNISTPKKLNEKEHLLLLSDSYIDITLLGECDFAISSETPFAYLTNYGGKIKSKQYYFYEKGSLFINPSEKLKQNINKESLQQVGFNICKIY